MVWDFCLKFIGFQGLWASGVLKVWVQLGSGFCHRALSRLTRRRNTDPAPKPQKPSDRTREDILENAQ